MNSSASGRARVISAVLLSASCLLGCGDGSETTTFEPTKLDIVELPGFPHSTDVYSVRGAKRALVILHGNGGHNFGVGHSLGIHDSDRPPTAAQIDWDWLEDQGVTVALPQGQALSDGSTETWSSRVMDSGADDVEFLQALAEYLVADLGVREVYLLGHSGGGMMANRMWCESPRTFAGYISVSGPTSAYYADPETPCSPDELMPYLGIFGDKDELLRIEGNWDADLWPVSTVVTSADPDAWLNPVLIGEWSNYVVRAGMLCDETPDLEDTNTGDAVERWTNCDGKLELQKVLDGQHKIESLESAGDYRILDEAMRFIDEADSADE